jgi:hypothetical protein
MAPESWYQGKEQAKSASLSSDRRLDQRGGCEKGFDAGEESGETVRLGDDSGDPEGGGEGLAENVAEHGVNDDGNKRQPDAEQRGGLDAIHVRHGEIEDDEIGLKGGGFIDSFGTVCSFAADFEGRIVLEKNAHRITNGDFIFDDENAFGHKATRNIARWFPEESTVNPVYEVMRRISRFSLGKAADDWFTPGQYEIESIHER